MWSPGVAALLSLIIPGAGQMYKGQVGKGLVWLLFVVLGYFVFIVPGLILHLICILGAAQGDPYAQQRSVAGQRSDATIVAPATALTKGPPTDVPRAARLSESGRRLAGTVAQSALDPIPWTV
jgi:TM2 domain-containing membrane protein YozV